MTFIEALKSREWTGQYDSFRDEYYRYYCKSCGADKNNGHAPDCQYAAAIREAERMEKAKNLDGSL